jgi:hypothetical protein
MFEMKVVYLYTFYTPYQHSTSEKTDKFNLASDKVGVVGLLYLYGLKLNMPDN